MKGVEDVVNNETDTEEGREINKSILEKMKEIYKKKLKNVGNKRQHTLGTYKMWRKEPVLEITRINKEHMEKRGTA